MEKNIINQKMQCFAHRLINKYQLKFDDVCFILNELKKDIFSKEPNILNINVPTYVVGAVNGNFDDIKEVFNIGGPLPYSTYLFLGNYTGENGSSLNTILLLFVYKYLYRDNIFFIQGSNEKKLQNKIDFENEKKSIPVCSSHPKLDLYKEILHLYDLEEAKIICNLFIEIFGILPVAAIISQMYFCVDSDFKLSADEKGKVYLSIDQIRKKTRKEITDGLVSITSRTKEFLKENKLVFLITGIKFPIQHNQKDPIHFKIFSSPHDAKENELCYVFEINENKVLQKIKMKPIINEFEKIYPQPKYSIIY